MAINHVTISGNLTRNPELRKTASGYGVLNFTVAVNERAKDVNGDYADRANYIDCVIFGKRAEALEGKMYKGQQVSIEGKLHYSSWEQDGKRRSKLEVYVNEIVLPPLAKKPSDSPKTASNNGYDHVRESDFSPYDENIPF